MYKGTLKQFKPENDYVPHMTVGKLSSIKLLDEAFEYVNGCNEKISTLVKKYQLKWLVNVKSLL